MIFKVQNTVEGTIQNWSKQLIGITKDNYRIYETPENTLKEWARRLNSLEPVNVEKQFFKTNGDSSKIIKEWANQLNKYFS